MSLRHIILNLITDFKMLFKYFQKLFLPCLLYNGPLYKNVRGAAGGMWGVQVWSFLLSQLMDGPEDASFRCIFRS